MPQLMRKQSADHLIPRRPPFLLGYKRVASVYTDQKVVRAG